MLTNSEWETIKDTFENPLKLVNHIGDILANATKEYKDHDAFLWKVAEEDSWPKKRKRQQSQSGELSEKEKEAIRKQEEEWRNS
jgi:hypothetical protein